MSNRSNQEHFSVLAQRFCAGISHLIAIRSVSISTSLQRGVQAPAGVDLETKTVTDAHGFAAVFEIGDYQRYCLLEGLDDIGLTLKHEADITLYEQRRPAWRQ
jgi:3-isopropylmalate dehydratase small subunit